MCVNVNARRAEKIGSELLRYPLNSSIYLLWCTCFVCWFRDIVEIARVRGVFLKRSLERGVFRRPTRGESFSTRICHLEILFDIVESACRYTLILHVHVTRDKR